MNKLAAPHVGGASPPKDAAVGDRGERAQSPWQMPWKAWRDVAVRSWNESTSDNIGLISAGVAFYGFLAVLPMLAATVDKRRTSASS